MDTACRTGTGDRRHGWRPGSVEDGDGACPLDARWTLGWAGVWASNKPGPLPSKDSEGITLLETGPDHCHDRQLLGHFAGQAAPRRTAVVCWIWMVREEGNGTTER